MIKTNSIVRNNLMTIENYSPYCGAGNCLLMPRTIFNGKQFECMTCGWISQFPEEFISKYKHKWNKR